MPFKHGHSNRTREYTAWLGMKERCNNPNHPHYLRYGGRGIKVCQPWQASFSEFLTHIGPKPSPAHSVDRIDNDGDYEPGNVRWATTPEQMRNFSKSRMLTLDGVTLCFKDWCRRLGISQSGLRNRLRKMPFDEAAKLSVGYRHGPAPGFKRKPRRGEAAYDAAKAELERAKG